MELKYLLCILLWAMILPFGQGQWKNLPMSYQIDRESWLIPPLLRKKIKTINIGIQDVIFTGQQHLDQCHIEIYINSRMQSSMTFFVKDAKAISIAKELAYDSTVDNNSINIRLSECDAVDNSFDFISEEIPVTTVISEKSLLVPLYLPSVSNEHIKGAELKLLYLQERFSFKFQLNLKNSYFFWSSNPTNTFVYTTTSESPTTRHNLKHNSILGKNMIIKCFLRRQNI